MQDPTARTLELLSLLQTHRHWSGTELAGRLDVTPRTLRRDIDRLRELGYRVNAIRGADGGYQLEAGSDLPPLVLNDEEAVAIAVGIRGAATGGLAVSAETTLSALAKLEQVLPSRLRHRVNALQSQIVSAQPGGPRVEPGLLGRLALAARDAERLRFTYADASGSETSRLADPHALVPVARRWYLVAWDVHRANWRTFRVDRVSNPFQTRVRFEPRELPSDDAAAFVEETLGSLPAKYSATVRIHAPVDEVQNTLGNWAKAATAIDADTTTWPISGDRLETLTTALIWLPWEFEVDGPQELAGYLATFATRVQRAIASDSP